MGPLFEATEGAASPVEVAAGAFHIPGALHRDQQLWLFTECLALMNGTVPAYVPTVRGGGRMHVRMLCLGLHWNGLLYRYEPTRSDFDLLPVPPVPEPFAELATSCAHRVGMRITPDICIMNYYDGDGRMGLHQDKDESPESLAAGTPVVSCRSAISHDSYSVARSGETRSARSASNRATRLSSVGPLDSRTTASLVSSTGRPQRRSGSRVDST